MGNNVSSQNNYLVFHNKFPPQPPPPPLGRKSRLKKVRGLRAQQATFTRNLQGGKTKSPPFLEELKLKFKPLKEGGDLEHHRVPGTKLGLKQGSDFVGGGGDLVWNSRYLKFLQLLASFFSQKLSIYVKWKKRSRQLNMSAALVAL